jgi:hypothetical protein
VDRTTEIKMTAARNSILKEFGIVTWQRKTSHIREIFISLLMAGKNTGRNNFGTSKSEISGERTRKRRSAKHLELPPVLLEGRRLIQLSYGRVLSL